MQYRLIASDIDGTLTEVWNQVNPRNREVLQQLVDQGVAFMIATGRSYRSAEAILRALNLPCYACLVNGAVLISYPELKLIRANYLSVEEKNQIVKIIHQHGGHMVIYNGFENGDKVYYTDTFHLNPVLTKIISSTQDRRIFVHDMIQDIQHPVPVISCVGTEEEIDTIFHALEECHDQFNILKLKEQYHEGYFWLMITQRHADKVHGIQQIADILGVAREEILAIGDDMNDLEMIKYAGLGIAMGNAVDPVKAAADRIAPHCSEDGMAQILGEVFGL